MFISKKYLKYLNLKNDNFFQKGSQSGFSTFEVIRSLSLIHWKFQYLLTCNKHIMTHYFWIIIHVNLIASLQLEVISFAGGDIILSGTLWRHYHYISDYDVILNYVTVFRILSFSKRIRLLALNWLLRFLYALCRRLGLDHPEEIL